MKLIDIDKIKAEVEKKTHGEQGYSSGDAECGYRDCARDILSFLNTIEVKEVDLEEEYKNFVMDDPVLNAFDSMGMILARHFYELGLKAQKEK